MGKLLRDAELSVPVDIAEIDSINGGDAVAASAEVEELEGGVGEEDANWARWAI